MLQVTPAIQIADSEIEFSFVRSPGPGGQKVNKTASAAQLRFDARVSPGIPASVFQRLRRLAGRRMTRDGVIVISASRHRTQERNREDAIGRLCALIRDAAEPPKRRRPTKPTAGAKERRLKAKRSRAGIKKNRRTVGPES